MARATHSSSLNLLSETEHDEKNSLTYDHHFSPIPLIRCVYSTGTEMETSARVFVEEEKQQGGNGDKRGRRGSSRSREKAAD